MSMGHDVAELLAEIRKKDQEIAGLLSSVLTEAEVKLAIDAICEVHTPERMTHEMRPEAASAVRKLTTLLDGFEARRRADADLLESLTDEERQWIRDMRAKKHRDA
jgi:hypothetical protein